MTLNEFKTLFSEKSVLKQSLIALQDPGSSIRWDGHIGSSLSLSSAAVAEQIPGNHLFILSDQEEAAYFLNDLQSLYPAKSNLLYYPESYKVPYELEQTDNANVVSRAEVMDKISHSRNNWIISYPNAIVEKLPSRKVLNKNTFRIDQGKSYGVDFLNEMLQELHFERVDFVYEPGQFSIRGGIVDVFSFANDNPYRIELFGDDVESIRSFDPITQLSVDKHKHLQVVPNVQVSLISEENVSIFDFIGEQYTIWVSSMERSIYQLDQAFHKAELKYATLNSAVSHLKPESLFIQSESLIKACRQQRLIELKASPYFQEAVSFTFNFKPQPSFNKNFALLAADLHDRGNEKYRSLIFSNQPRQIERLEQIFSDTDREVKFTPMPFALHEGFIDPELKLLCYTDHPLFERYHRFRLKEGFRQARQALTLKELQTLQPGDYITHIDHGVGRFSGLETIDVNGKMQEAVRLVYRDNDVLYVGVHSLHRISRFTGKDGSVPSVNKLGTQTWSTLKNKTKKRIKELAFDLIQLYAKRKSKPGFAFSPDTYLQDELEASFMYEDTPDQLRATIAVKEDMESETPMDRLICGDVGFGKTEIAIRAAFKAITDNKQVAVLVPTTILSMQHYRSFKERLKDFPGTVDYINRFKSAKQTSETLKKLAEGKVDILIGTHAIVNEKVKFKDLGLIIIDEEQKFGVSVKDKLKTFRETVDTLTLTATPIPRTLQFSLMGARDLSIINTPPPNRQPVLTEIITYQEESIRDAISYEVSRGGQVFFIHNRLQNIREVGGMIQRLCPGVRLAIGHGQMDGKQLEDIMFGFINHDYDVLLATTIIESGIDIANANTIIINNAHNFGISDLHQLRGRVGRSNRKGFCYLIAPPASLMTSEARKRLEALVQFSDLGSGFNIAMKDLDIRGAGNMLGGEQSGFIADIGFEMYQKILNEAIQELSEGEFKELFKDRKSDQFQPSVRECQIETDLEIRIPDTYVNAVAERLSLYQQFDALRNEQELTAILSELEDRFGPLPEQVHELALSIRLRWLAQYLGFEKLVIKSNKMIAYFVGESQADYFNGPIFSSILNFIQQRPTGVKLVEKQQRLRMVFEKTESLHEALGLLQAIKEHG